MRKCNASWIYVEIRGEHVRFAQVNVARWTKMTEPAYQMASGD
jgi:hypothetical protein